MTTEIQNFLKQIYGKPCCKQRVLSPRSLRLGFGEKLFHGKSNLADPFYGEWEIGTYYCAWRVIKHGRILCGSSDLAESPSELTEDLCRIDFGCIKGISQLTSFDVRVVFDGGVTVDFLATTSDATDECFFAIDGPRHVFVQYSLEKGWEMGRSDQPVNHRTSGD